MSNTASNTTTDSSQIQGRTSQFSMASHGNYNVNNLSYPEGVSTDPDKLHYVCFFINVRGKSKVFANQKPSPTSAQGANNGENRVNTQQLGTAAAITGGIGLGGTVGLGLGSILGKTKFNSSLKNGLSSASANVAATAVKVGVGVAGAAIGAAAVDFAVQPDTTYRISDVITLHLPHAPKYSYGATYTETELGTVLGLMSGGSSAVDASKTAMGIESVKALVLAGANIGASKVGKATGGLVTGENVTSAIQISEGQSLNPFREVLFKGMSFRKHVFNYTFMPKSADEALAVFNIIKTFRYHQHPELSQASLYLIHPSEFVAQIYFDGKENTNFPKMATMVLEGLDVQYGDGTRFSSFYDGSATEISLTLQFREVSTLTKADINNGF